MAAVQFETDDQELTQLLKQINARKSEHMFDPTLDRMRAAVALLGHPELCYQVIHVAGTNGKTSTARIAEALLRARGMRTGLLTSPPLTDPRDRIALDGARIGTEQLADAWRELRPVAQMVDAESLQAGGNPLGLFEIWTLLGLTAFADAPVDAAVIEVGMGGSWDATNVVDSQVQVVTPIALDHQGWLGEGIESIAAEKAGIIESVAVIARQSPAALRVLREAARDKGARVLLEDAAFGVMDREDTPDGQVVTLHGLEGVYGPMFLPLRGAHQAHNAATGLAAVEALGLVSAAQTAPSNWPAPLPDPVSRTDQGPAPPEEARLVADGLAGVRVAGRLEIVRRAPLVLIDAAHNPAGASVLAEAIQDGPFPRLIGLVGVLGDKDAEGILGALEPVVVSVVITRSSSPRAMDPDRLGELAREVFGPDRVRVTAALDQALIEAIELADEDTGSGPVARGTGVLATGSVTVAGEVRRLLAPDDADR